MDALETPPHKAWHGLFATADFQALHEALAAGVVPEMPAEGRDFLGTVLCRPPAHFGLQSLWDPSMSVPAYCADNPESEPVLRQGRVTALVQALLSRPDVDPFRQFSFRRPDRPDRTEPVTTHALGLALALDQGPAVEAIHQWARTHDRLEDFARAMAAPAMPQVPVIQAQHPPLLAAILADRAGLVRTLLALGENPNACDATGRPALFHASSPATLQALLDAGADAGTQHRSVDLLTHLGARARQDTSSTSAWKKMLDVVSGHDPGAMARTLPQHALLWWGQANLDTQESFQNVRDVRANEWKKGWKEKVAPALAVAPLDQLRSTLPTGPLRGQASAASTMGWRWASREGRLACHLAFLDPAHCLVGPAPMPIRPGLEDWDVLLLGAAAHRQARLPRKPGNIQATQMLAESQAAARALAGKLGTPEQCDARIIRAAALLGRPKNAPVRSNMALAWSSHLATREAEGLGATSLLALAARGARAGVRWGHAFHGVWQVKDSEAAHTRALETLARWLRKAGPAHASPQACRDLVEAGVCALADLFWSQAAATTGTAHPDVMGQARPFLVETLLPALRRLDGMPRDLAAPVATRLEELEQALSADPKAQDLAAALAEQRMETALKAPPPATASARHRM